MQLLYRLTDRTKKNVKKECNVQDAENDTVVVSHADLEEVEVIEENYENEGDDVNEPPRLSTVQENEPTTEVKKDLNVEKFYDVGNKSHCNGSFFFFRGRKKPKQALLKCKKRGLSSVEKIVDEGEEVRAATISPRQSVKRRWMGPRDAGNNARNTHDVHACHVRFHSGAVLIHMMI